MECCEEKKCPSRKHVGGGNYICKHDNLKVRFPELVGEWHPDNEPMENYSAYSKKEVPWRCRKNPCGCHIWMSSISNRTGKVKSKCPFCSKKAFCKHNSLKALYPELIPEWHEDNESMENYFPHSNKEVKWKCPDNPCGCHVYLADINHRTRYLPIKNNCPFCLNRELCKHNNLKVLHPELIDEWHEDNGPMENYPPSYSTERMKWRCKINPCGCHIWKTFIHHRAGKAKSGCPFCSHHKLCPHNNLKALHPELVDEWHPDNGPMENFAPGSDERKKWICSSPKNSCGCHIWITAICDRTGPGKKGCSFCSRLKFCVHNNLFINYPELQSQWHPDNGPMESFPCHSDYKAKWMCIKDKNCIWEAIIYNRTRRPRDGCGCPKCRMCPSCGLWQTYGRLCPYCKPKNQNKLYQKTKEIKIVTFLKEKLPDEEFIHNKSVGKDCTNVTYFQIYFFNVVIIT